MSRQDADNVSATLVATYAAVWAALQEQQRRAVLSGSRRQIREFINQVKAWTQSLDRQTYEWASEQFGTIYGLGALQGLEPTGDSFQWTPAHEAAATGIAGDVWTSLRQANENVRRSAAKVGHVSREVTRSTTPEELAAMLAKHGAAAVVYKGGARHGLEDYARMLLRTQTSIAYNKAGLAAGKDAGIDWYEVSDGPGCFAADTRLGAYGGLVGMVRQWYEGPAFVLSMVTSKRLTVGPHHPVLTSRGWVEAQFVRQGDKVIDHGGLYGPVPLSGSDLAEMPTAEDQFAALTPRSGVFTRRALANDLHGDAQVGQHEIEVVGTKRSLLLEGNATLAKKIREVGLAWADADLASLPRDCAALARSDRDGDTHRRSVSRSHLRVPFRRCLGRPLAVRAARPGAVDTRGVSSLAVERRTTPLTGARSGGLDPRPSSESIARLAGDSHATPGAEGPTALLARLPALGAWRAIGVESVQEIHYQGFMYDATATDGVLTGNGILIRNCGWESHNDGDEANGKIVPGDEAETHLLAHPNCQRLFSGRPDIRSAEEALAAGAENAGDAPTQAEVDAGEAATA